MDLFRPGNFKLSRSWFVTDNREEYWARVPDSETTLVITPFFPYDLLDVL